MLIRRIIKTQTLHHMKLKRTLYLFALAAGIVMSNSTVAQKLESEFLYKISLTLDTPVDLQKVPVGKRVIYPVTGGTFEVTTKLDVRLLLETDDGHLISTTYSGIVYNNPDGTTYWRITPVFETSSTKYGWLNYLLAVGVGSVSKGGVSYEVFAIK
jgi:hypothetical protein